MKVELRACRCACSIARLVLVRVGGGCEGSGQGFDGRCPLIHLPRVPGATRAAARIRGHLAEAVVLQLAMDVAEECDVPRVGICPRRRVTLLGDQKRAAQLFLHINRCLVRVDARRDIVNLQAGGTRATGAVSRGFGLSTGRLDVTCGRLVPPRPPTLRGSSAVHVIEDCDVTPNSNVP